MWTAVHWLHSLGFERVSSEKDIYVDGHERQDVVHYRKFYFRKHEIMASMHAPPMMTKVGCGVKRIRYYQTNSYD